MAERLSPPAAPPNFAGELYFPVYRPLRYGRWEVVIGGVGFAPGYWSGQPLFLGRAALLRDGETWMSISPLEIESEEIGIRAGRGHVLILGLGLGWAAGASALRPE